MRNYSVPAALRRTVSTRDFSHSSTCRQTKKDPVGWRPVLSSVDAATLALESLQSHRLMQQLGVDVDEATMGTMDWENAAGSSTRHSESSARKRDKKPILRERYGQRRGSSVDLSGYGLEELEERILKQGRRNIADKSLIVTAVDELIRRPLIPFLGLQHTQLLGGGSVHLSTSDWGPFRYVIATPQTSLAKSSARSRFSSALSEYQRRNSQFSPSKHILAYGRLLRDATDLSFTVGEYERCVELSLQKIAEGLGPYLQPTATVVDAAFLLPTVPQALTAIRQLAVGLLDRLSICPTDGLTELCIYRCLWRACVLWRDVRLELAPSLNIVRAGRRKLQTEAEAEMRKLKDDLEMDTSMRPEQRVMLRRILAATPIPDTIERLTSTAPAFTEYTPEMQAAISQLTQVESAAKHIYYGALCSPMLLGEMDPRAAAAFEAYWGAAASARQAQQEGSSGSGSGDGKELPDDEALMAAEGAYGTTDMEWKGHQLTPSSPLSSLVEEHFQSYYPYFKQLKARQQELNPLNTSNRSENLEAPRDTCFLTLWRTATTAVLYNDLTDDGCSAFHEVLFERLTRAKRGSEIASSMAPSKYKFQETEYQVADSEEDYQQQQRNTTVSTKANPLLLQPSPMVQRLLQGCVADFAIDQCVRVFDWYWGCCARGNSPTLVARTATEILQGRHQSLIAPSSNADKQLASQRRTMEGVVLFTFMQSLMDMKAHARIVEYWGKLSKAMEEEEAAVMPPVDAGGLEQQADNVTISRPLLHRASVLAIVARAAAELQQPDLTVQLIQLLLDNNQSPSPYETFTCLVACAKSRSHHFPKMLKIIIENKVATVSEEETRYLTLLYCSLSPPSLARSGVAPEDPPTADGDRVGQDDLMSPLPMIKTICSDLKVLLDHRYNRLLSEARVSRLTQSPPGKKGQSYGSSASEAARSSSGRSVTPLQISLAEGAVTQRVISSALNVCTQDVFSHLLLPLFDIVDKMVGNGSGGVVLLKWIEHLVLYANNKRYSISRQERTFIYEQLIKYSLNDKTKWPLARYAASGVRRGTNRSYPFLRAGYEELGVEFADIAEAAEIEETSPNPNEKSHTTATPRATSSLMNRLGGGMSLLPKAKDEHASTPSTLKRIQDTEQDTMPLIDGGRRLAVAGGPVTEEFRSHLSMFFHDYATSYGISVGSSTSPSIKAQQYPASSLRDSRPHQSPLPTAQTNIINMSEWASMKNFTDPALAFSYKRRLLAVPSLTICDGLKDGVATVAEADSGMLSDEPKELLAYHNVCPVSELFDRIPVPLAVHQGQGAQRQDSPTQQHIPKPDYFITAGPTQVLNDLDAVPDWAVVERAYEEVLKVLSAQDDGSIIEPQTTEWDKGPQNESLGLHVEEVDENDDDEEIDLRAPSPDVRGADGLLISTYERREGSELMATVPSYESDTAQPEEDSVDPVSIVPYLNARVRQLAARRGLQGSGSGIGSATQLVAAPLVASAEQIFVDGLFQKAIEASP